MKEIRKTIIFVLAMLSLMNSFAQNKTIIRGRVIDKADKTTIIGANIIEYNRENRVINGTITNVNGDFVLQLIDPGNVVSVSVIGYTTQTIKVDPSRAVIVELSSSDIQIGEITVTAQAQTSNRLTNIEERDNASSTVKIDLIEMHNEGIVSAADALQGKVSGLDIISSSGDPGSGSSLVIRGLSSMGNSRPLVVIDGIPQMRISRDFDLTSADTEDISNLINIALQDIKSIEVLKDAASTAAYGSQGADGVLLIETNKGRMGKVQFDYNYKYSLNVQPPATPMLNGDEYIMLQLEEWHNSQGVFDLPAEIAYDRDYIDFYNYSANTDWIAAVTSGAQTHDHFFKVSGGGEKTRYYTSFSYIDEGGTTINTNAKMFFTRINFDYFLSRKLLFSVQFNYNSNSTEGNMSISGRNIRQMAYIKAPNMSIWEYDQFGKLTGEYFTPINSYQGYGGDYYNPVAVSELGKNDYVENMLQNTFILRYKISDWLTFNETVSFQYSGSKSKSFLPFNAMGTDWLQWTVNKADETNSLSSSKNIESQILFNVPFQAKQHVLSGSATWIVKQSQYGGMNIQSNKTPSVNIQDPSVNAQINWQGSWSGASRDLSGVFNLNYKLHDRYMVQTILRADANSAFGDNNRWGLFKGVSLGWRFSHEPLLDSWDFLGDCMLRASWGVSGKQPGDTYARFATYSTTANGNYIQNPAIIPTSIQLDNIKWESITSYDLGLELNLFDDRLYLEGDLYNKLTTNILFGNYSIPTSSGFPQLKYLNSGELENKGWELMTEIRAIRQKNWYLSFSFNTSQNINAFTKLPENFNTERSTSIGNGQYPLRVVEGEPIGSFFGFRYLGVWPSDEMVKATDADGNILVDSEGKRIPFTYLGTYNFKGGDAIYEDINHDGKIDLNDVVYIGDSNPNFVGGFGTNLKYKNFNFALNFNYRMGFDIVNRVAIDTENMSGRHNQSKAVLNRWRVQGQDEEGMLPRAYLNHPANYLGSDRFVEKGDFIRLNSITMGYRFSQTLCSKLGLRSANLAFSARKLLTFTNYTGQDPEVSMNASNPFWIGEDRANTPPSKVFTLSLSIGF